MPKEVLSKLEIKTIKHVDEAFKECFLDRKKVKNAKK
jgi:hypothetical protein